MARRLVPPLRTRVGDAVTGIRHPTLPGRGVRSARRGPGPTAGMATAPATAGSVVIGMSVPPTGVTAIVRVGMTVPPTVGSGRVGMTVRPTGVSAIARGGTSVPPTAGSGGAGRKARHTAGIGAIGTTNPPTTVTARVARTIVPLTGVTGAARGATSDPPTAGTAAGRGEMTGPHTVGTATGRAGMTVRHTAGTGTGTGRAGMTVRHTAEDDETGTRVRTPTSGAPRPSGRRVRMRRRAAAPPTAPSARGSGAASTPAGPRRHR